MIKILLVLYYYSIFNKLLFCINIFLSPKYYHLKKIFPPHQHERKIFGAHVCRVASKYLPQPITSDIQSLRTIGIFLTPLSAHEHPTCLVGVVFTQT